MNRSYGPLPTSCAATWTPPKYKHVVLGLIFLKYISDAFEEVHARLLEKQFEGADSEDRDEYLAENVFWVPPEARWKSLQANARQPNVGKLIDDAMLAIERDNPTLKSVLPAEYARRNLEVERLGGLIDLISGIGLGSRAPPISKKTTSPSSKRWCA